MISSDPSIPEDAVDERVRARVGAREEEEALAHAQVHLLERVLGRPVPGRVHFCHGIGARHLPDMTSAKFSDFFIPPPLSTFETDLQYKIHTTTLTMSAFPRPPPPSNADIISGSPLMRQ